jgi:hypothetical protein
MSAFKIPETIIKKIDTIRFRYCSKELIKLEWELQGENTPPGKLASAARPLGPVESKRLQRRQIHTNLSEHLKW